MDMGIREKGTRFAWIELPGQHQSWVDASLGTSEVPRFMIAIRLWIEQGFVKSGVRVTLIIRW